MLPDPWNTIDDHRSTGILIVNRTTIRLLEGIIPMIQYGVDTQRRDRKIDLPIVVDFRLDDPTTMIFTAGTHHGCDIQIEGLIMT